MDARASVPGLGHDPAANARKRRHTDSFDAAPQHISQRPHKMPRAVSQSFSMHQPEYYQPQPQAYSEPLHQFPVFYPVTQPLSAAEAYHHPLAFDPSAAAHETLWSPSFQPAVPMPVTSTLMRSPLGPAVASARYGPPADAHSVEMNTPYQFHPATFPTPDLTESEADDFNQQSNRLSRSVSVAQEPKQHYDSLAMGYMTASSSATPGHRDTGTPSSLPAPPAAYQQSLSPPHIEPRPSLPPSAASIDTTPHVYSPSPSRALDSQPAAAATTPPKGMKCHHCHEPCKGPKALKRHVWEQHEMYWCHFCPLCSYLVSFEPRQREHESGQGDSGSLKVLKCSHCDDDEPCLAPQDVVPHFRKYHYHSLSSTRMLFIKRPDDVSRHFDAKKKKKDDAHRWLHEHVEVAKDVFKVEDSNSNTVRGCDRGCDDCGGSLDGLAGFVKHCSDTRKDGLPQAQKDDTAFTLQVRNILSSERLQLAWAACLEQRGEPAKIKWKYNGEAPSKLLADLEAAATYGLEPRDKLIERAYDMMHGKGNGSR